MQLEHCLVENPGAPLVLVTSPPWGILKAAHDKKLNYDSIGVNAHYQARLHNTGMSFIHQQRNNHTLI
jgi:hypothetical protein